MHYNYDSTYYNDAPDKDLGDIAKELLTELNVTELRSQSSVRTLDLLAVRFRP